MNKAGYDSYKEFVCAKIMEDAVDAVGVELKNRVWVCSPDAELDCVLRGIDYEKFKDLALKKIDRNRDQCDLGLLSLRR
ncbi:MAG: hypothetical protein HY007_03040 [Candidatus Sungbacteria bacterium]|nr:hypothetical protein [Candidatus Sungbacteria bacterium]